MPEPFALAIYPILLGNGVTWNLVSNILFFLPVYFLFKLLGRYYPPRTRCAETTILAEDAVSNCRNDIFRVNSVSMNCVTRMPSWKQHPQTRPNWITTDHNIQIASRATQFVGMGTYLKSSCNFQATPLFDSSWEQWPQWLACRFFSNFVRGGLP